MGVVRLATTIGSGFDDLEHYSEFADFDELAIQEEWASFRLRIVLAQNVRG
jgi:hypothetical protein